MKDRKWDKQTFPWNSTVNLNNPFRSPFLHKLIKSKEFEAYSKLDDLTLTIILLSAYIFMSDRFLSKAEVSLLSKRIHEIYPEHSLNSLEKVIRRFADLFEPRPNTPSNTALYEVQQPVFGTVKGLNKLLIELKSWVAKRTIKNSIAYLLFEIALVDNNITRSERYHLIKICRQLGLLDMEISRMFAFFDGRINDITFHTKHSWNTTAAEKKAYSDQFKKKAIPKQEPKPNAKKKTKTDKKPPPKTGQKIYAIDTAYWVLGVSRNADNRAVKKAYRKLVMKYHADRQVNASELEKQTAKKMFKTIHEAYEYIKIMRRMK